jgi:CubicO group peptidase (beta-lactamase class C family)
MRFALTLSLLIIGPAIVTAADPVIDQFATQALGRFDVPGVSIVVVKNGQVHHANARGVRELGKPDALTTADVFPLASCTKAFTAALAAKLGILDDPVRKHIPAFQLADARADALVTIRDLLTHRTGVGGHDLLWYHAPWTLDDSVRRLGKLPATGGFREAFQYSTLQYIAAGQAVAAAGKAPWHEQIHTQFTVPLGMASVTFTTTDAAFVTAPRPAGHSGLHAAKVKAVPMYAIAEPNPAGSINLVPRDIAPWLILQLGKPNRVLSPDVLAETHRPQMVMPPPPKSQFPETVQLNCALGWVVYDYRGHRLLAHGGIIDGFRTQIVLAPDHQVGLAIFCNRQDTKLPQALAHMIIDHLLQLPAKDWLGVLEQATQTEQAAAEALIAQRTQARASAKPMAFAIAAYAGTYEHPAYGTATVTVDKDKGLVWKWSSFESAIEYWGDEIFVVTRGVVQDRRIQFQCTATAITGLVFESQHFRKVK